MNADIELGGVYHLPSGHYALVEGAAGSGDVKVVLVNVKIMRPMASSAMQLRASFLIRRARLCWKSFDWQRRIADVAVEEADQLARKERQDLARHADISRAKAIDAEHAAQKAANRRLLRIAA